MRVAAAARKRVVRIMLGSARLDADTLSQNDTRNLVTKSNLLVTTESESYYPFALKITC
jgi:hypothetical protein